MNWIMFFLGTLAYFLYKFITRSKKTIAPTLKFWWKDNAPELLLSFVVDFAVALALIGEVGNFDPAKMTFIPEWLPFGFVVKLFFFFIGYGGGLLVYNILQKKVKDVKG